MAESYSVQHDDASAVATSTRGELSGLTTAKSELETALQAAKGALPPEFGDAVSRLGTLSTEHAEVVEEAKTYADKCVTAFESCLAVYEDASAQMVYEQRRKEDSIVFDHGSILTGTESDLERGISEGLAPINDPMKDKPDYSVSYQSETKGISGGDDSVQHSGVQHHSKAEVETPSSKTTYEHNSYTGTTTYAPDGVPPVSQTDHASRDEFTLEVK